MFHFRSRLNWMNSFQESPPLLGGRHEPADDVDVVPPPLKADHPRPSEPK